MVHPSWTQLLEALRRLLVLRTRFLRLILWPLASEEFWDYFHSHERRLVPKTSRLYRAEALSSWTWPWT